VNGLFTLFDKLVEEHKVYKMETIGDAYVCVSGLPDYNEGMHSATSMLLLGIECVEAVARYKELCSLPSSLGLRVGVHSGRGVGGVVGRVMQRYHIFGRTMHVTELLEATAPAQQVQASGTTAQLHLDEVTMGLSTDVLRRGGACVQLQERALEGLGLTTSKGEAVDLSELELAHSAELHNRVVELHQKTEPRARRKEWTSRRKSDLAHVIRLQELQESLHRSNSSPGVQAMRVPKSMPNMTFDDDGSDSDSQ